MTALPGTEPHAALGPEGEQCLHCGAVLAPDQRYCVNCGLRRSGPRVEYRALLGESLTRVPAGEPAEAPPPPQATVPPPPPAVGETRTVSPLGAALAIGLLLLAVLVGGVLGRGGDDSAPAPVVVGGAAPAASAAFTSDWAEGDGWTIQLLELPKASTQPAQVAAAKADASSKGAPDVGALDSDTYPSLNPGSYLVYSGRFGSKADAEKALDGVTASFPDAVVVEVSTTAGGAGGADDTSKDEAADKAPAPSGAVKTPPSKETQDFVKKSRKLPDKVGTGGSAPPTDNKAPGGGSDGGLTIE